MTDVMEPEPPARMLPDAVRAAIEGKDPRAPISSGPLEVAG
jgi:hypothetical protein